MAKARGKYVAQWQKHTDVSSNQFRMLWSYIFPLSLVRSAFICSTDSYSCGKVNEIIAPASPSDASDESKAITRGVRMYHSGMSVVR